MNRTNTAASRGNQQSIVSNPFADCEQFFSDQSTYIIECAALNAVKIGRSFDVDKRMRTLQTGCPHDLKTFAVFPLDIEMELHLVFGDKVMRGEWFSVSPSDVAVVAMGIVKDSFLPETRPCGEKVEWGIYAADDCFGPQIVSNLDATIAIEDGNAVKILWVGVNEYIAIHEFPFSRQVELAETLLAV